jgi:adenylate cyclase
MRLSLPPAEVIEILNCYFDCVIPPIKRYGGEVLEFLGDGILAILSENEERSATQSRANPASRFEEKKGEPLDPLKRTFAETTDREMANAGRPLSRWQSRTS